MYRHKGSDDASLVEILRFVANTDTAKQTLSGMARIEANMEHTEDLTLDDIREVLRLMQQEGMFDLSFNLSLISRMQTACMPAESSVFWS